MASNFCGQCGTPLDPATGRCPNCEPQVCYQPPPGQPYAPPPEQAYYGQPYPPQEPGYAAPPKKDKKNALIVVLIVLVALLAVAAAVTALGMNGVLDFPFLRGQEAEPAVVTTAMPATDIPTTTMPADTAPAGTAPVTEAPTTAAPAPSVTAPPDSAAAPAGQQYKLENPMRLRAGPGTGYGYSKVIPTDAYVGVVSTQGEWAYVLCEGEYGWIHGPTAFPSWWNGGVQNETPDAASFPYNAKLKNAMKLREGPGTEYGAKIVIPSGSVVTVYEMKLNDAGEVWARVLYNGVEGWVRQQEAGV